MQTLVESADSTAAVPPSWHQPAFFKRFRCIGADCEDTCCQGMAVNVDAQTFAKYESCPDVELKPRLRQFVTIRPAPTEQNFATIQPENSACPFLSEKLCSLQQKLGVEYLSKVCDTYPRLLRLDGPQGERSLDLSCPEAARIVLTGPDPIRFESTSEMEPRHWNVRKLILSILQNRRYAVSKRLLLVGHVCSKLADIGRAGEMENVSDVLGGFELAIEGGFFDGHLRQARGKAIPQLVVALELIVGRIQLDYASPRFLELYNDFTAGLQLAEESTLDELGLRYSDCCKQFFTPFMSAHEYILENYLVAYAYQNVFPFANAFTGVGTNIEDQYLLMATYFSLVKALMIGLAGQRREAFGIDDAVRVIQLAAKTFEHCTTYPALILKTLVEKGIQNTAGMAILTQGFATPQYTTARG